jgi:anthranilate phosphoribosyltransferase
VVLLNAAAGLVVGGKASSLRDGIELARESIRSGKALACLDNLVELTNKL